MGGYTIPISEQDPIYGYPYGPYGGRTGAVQANTRFDPSTGFTIDVDPNAPMEDVFASNRNFINTTGNVIGGEAGAQLAYYDPIQRKYQSAQDVALNRLNETPGFTPDEASRIGVDYSQYNTPESGFTAMAGDPNAPVQSLEQGLGAEGAMLNQYQEDLGSQLGQYSKNLGGAVDQYATGVGGAAAGLGQGLQEAQGKFDALNEAVYDPSLGFDPNSTEKQLTDQDVQNMRTAAGVSVGNKFRTDEDTLMRQAAQQGNTSPAALQAMRERLTLENAATAGNVENEAEIAAKQAQYQRAAEIEGQRLGAAQTRQGMRASAATTEQAQAQAAAGLAGQANLAAQGAIGSQRVGAANQLGQANLNAVNQYGQFSTNQANTMTGQRYGAQSTAEQLAANRAGTIANTRYGQGTGSAQLTSQGAQTTGGARIAGQGAYRSGVAQQQGMAQQGGQAAVQAQNQAFGTQAGALNQNASGQANFEVGKPSFGDALARGAANTISSGFGLFDKGGVITEPTVAKIAEHGPEMVVPIGRYRSKRQIEEEAA